MKLQNLFYFISFLFILTGCKKTESVKSVEGRGKTIVTLSVPNATNGYALQAIDVSDNPQSFAIIELIRNVPNQDELNKPLTVAIISDSSSLSSYNVTNGKNLEFLPDSVYSLDGATKSGNNFSITFQPGEFSKKIKLVFPKTTNLNLTKQYAFGFTLLNTVSGSDAIVSANGSRSGVIEIALKNKYDGIYKVHSYIARYTDAAGTTVDAALSGYPAVFEVTLITTSANGVVWDKTHYWASGTGVAGIGVPAFSTLSTDSVNVTSTVNPASPGTPVGNVSGYEHRYDPVNKIYYVSYGWISSTGLPRFITDTLVFDRAR